jgi:hypothetical protein
MLAFVIHGPDRASQNERAIVEQGWYCNALFILIYFNIFASAAGHGQLNIFHRIAVLKYRFLIVQINRPSVFNFIGS